MKNQTLNSTRLLLIEEPFAIFKTTEVTGKHRLCPQGFKKLRIRYIGLGFVTQIGYIELRGKCLDGLLLDTDSVGNIENIVAGERSILNIMHDMKRSVGLMGLLRIAGLNFFYCSFLE